MVQYNYQVYCHINKTNGKKYIGQTKLEPEKRWGRNGCKYKGSRHFWFAIQKYGWNNFEHEIIASNLTLDEANNFEELLIQKLQTTNPKFGYNIARGGNNKEPSLETLQIWHKQRNNGKHYMAKKVLCDGKIYNSITSCAKHYEVTISQMKNWLNKKNNMPEKFISLHLCYADFPEEIYETQHPLSYGDNPRAKEVFCEGKIFACAKECAEYYNVNYHTFMNWLYGYKRMPQSFIDKNLHFKGEGVTYLPKKRHIRTVICDNKEFVNISECAKNYKVVPNNMSRWLNGERLTPQKFKDMNLRFKEENES